METSSVFRLALFRDRNKLEKEYVKKSIIALAIEGDKEAFNTLIEENLKSLYIVARGILNNEQDIEDAFQSTIIKAYEKITSLRKEEYFKTWLTKIMINECTNIIRKSSKVIYMEDSQINNESYNDEHQNFDLVNAINSLSEGLRIVTWLFYFDDMSIEEIADTLGMAKGTVKSRLNRSREKLYYIMREEEYRYEKF